MSTPGYFRFPTIFRDTIVFTCEDDLWTVPSTGGVARRLTAGQAECKRPHFSPDGEWIAFTGREEGNPEVYVMPSRGGPAQRLTFLGAISCTVAGWDGDEVLFATNHGQPFWKLHTIHAVGRESGHIRSLKLGSAMSLSRGEDGRRVIGRNTLDIARWKRYRGGTAGNLWLETETPNEFEPYIPCDKKGPIRSNLASPMVIGQRFYFVSDHEGVGNLYSALRDGRDLKRHTHHAEYYVRNPTTDGQRIVYHAGGDIYCLDPSTDTPSEVSIEHNSPQTQRNRKFLDAAKFLEDYAVHPNGHAFAVTTRGHSFTAANWEEAVHPVGNHGKGQGEARYRLTQWLADGSHLITVTDAYGEETLELYAEKQSQPEAVFKEFDIGRVLTISVSPTRNEIALTNHRQELLLIDLDTRKARTIDRSEHFQIMGVSFSPDGRHLAYGFHNSLTTSIIKIATLESGETHEVTRTVLRDVMPSFDPEGGYLYFLSYRVFNPVYDNLDFDMNFPKGVRPYCLVLNKELPSPFIPLPKSSEELRKQRLREVVGEEEEKELDPRRLEIDFDGIQERIVEFPVPEGKYEQLYAARDKVFFTSTPVAPMIDPLAQTDSKSTLFCYNFESFKLETVAQHVHDFTISPGGETLMYRSKKRLRLISTQLQFGRGWDSSKRGSKPCRETGWLDLTRFRPSISPVAEWRQMYREAWRLQRDNFWTEDMSGVDWLKVLERYEPLLDRVASRSEFSDLMWEMQGELGTSHCYEMGGDYRPQPRYAQGFLGADFEYDGDAGAYKIRHIVRGDSWQKGKDSPLAAPGLNIKEGSLLLAVGGQRLSSSFNPGMSLVNLADQNVTLTVADPNGENRRTVVTRALKSDTALRYREWVEGNRRKVLEATDGRAGYVHIPNMMGLGMSEFFRGFLADVNREALVVDVRFNGGGHTSQLILEKLARKRIGYGLSRWGTPESYPSNAVMGPIVALTNEFAGSDGDIFSHSFKMMKLGTLIGKRTWGGVIGVWPRHPLVDGTVTTQPEYSFWFEDAKWGVENYGTEPHIEVEFKPQDSLAGRDPQLERAIEEIKRQLEVEKPKLPEFRDRPNLALPTLPNRNA